jgi:hypothetical protein
VSYTGQSRPHKQNTQEGGSRAHARIRGGTPTEAMSEAERISLEKRLGQIQCELGEACRKKEAARGEALFAEQCRHHSDLGWTEPRRPKWLDFPGEILRPDDLEREITDDERRHLCEQVRRLANRCNTRARQRKVHESRLADDGSCRASPHATASAQSQHFHLWKPQSLIVRKSNDSKLRKGSLRIVSGNSSTQLRLPATQHLGPKAAAMTRNGCRLRKAEANREIILSSRRVAEIERQLQHLRINHAQQAIPGTANSRRQEVQSGCNERPA